MVIFLQIKSFRTHVNVPPLNCLVEEINEHIIQNKLWQIYESHSPGRWRERRWVQEALVLHRSVSLVWNVQIFSVEEIEKSVKHGVFWILRIPTPVSCQMSISNLIVFKKSIFNDSFLSTPFHLDRFTFTSKILSIIAQPRMCRWESFN